MTGPGCPGGDAGRAATAGRCRRCDARVTRARHGEPEPGNHCRSTPSEGIMKLRTSFALAGSAAALATAGLVAGPALASSASATHTLKFTTHTITMHSFGKTGGV